MSLPRVWCLRHYSLLLKTGDVVVIESIDQVPNRIVLVIGVRVRTLDEQIQLPELFLLIVQRQSGLLTIQKTENVEGQE